MSNLRSAADLVEKVFVPEPVRPLREHAPPERWSSCYVIWFGRDTAAPWCVRRPDGTLFRCELVEGIQGAMLAFADTGFPLPAGPRGVLEAQSAEFVGVTEGIPL